MSRPLLRKTFDDGRWLLIAGAATLFAFAWIRVIIVASMERYQFQRIARNLPDMIKRLSPVPIEELVSYPGLVGFTFEEPMVYLILAVWAIARGSDCVSGEIGRGTMEMLLAQPISRARYIVTHSSVTLLGVLILASAVHAGTWAGVETTYLKRQSPVRSWKVPFLGEIRTKPTEPQKIPISRFVKIESFNTATVNYACLGFFLTGVTTAVSSIDRFRWRTIGIVVGFYVIETVIELTGIAVEGMRWLLYLTFFSAYEPVAFVTEANQHSNSAWQFLASETHGFLPDLGPMGCHTVLVVLGGIGFLVASVVFCRRDLPAPL